MAQSYFHVIMPFGSDSGARLKQGIIIKVAEAYDFEPRFPAYDSFTLDFDLRLALEDLEGSAFVLADLSLERPSCYYELGLAEALGKTMYLIAAHGTPIHQTANRKFVRFYNDLKTLEYATKEVLKEAAFSAPGRE